MRANNSLYTVHEKYKLGQLYFNGQSYQKAWFLKFILLQKIEKEFINFSR